MKTRGKNSLREAEDLLAEAEHELRTEHHPAHKGQKEERTMGKKKATAKKEEPKTEAPKEKREKFERHLRVILSREQVEELSDRAAHLMEEHDSKEENQKAAQKQMKAEIEAIEAKIRETLGYVRDKAKYQDVQCERVFDYARGMVVEKRLDTDELLQERAMTADERQLGLDLEEDEKDDKSLEDEFEDDDAAAE
jgi:hypothetical protein